MSKLTLNDIANLQNETSVVTLLNANSALMEEDSDNSLSRDGSSPNWMGAALDMNSYRILNLPEPASALEPLRQKDLVDFLDGDLTLTQVVNNEAKFTTYGAVGDGTTDDTVAVQAALDSGVKVIRADAGKTFIVSELTIGTAITLVLDPGSTIKMKTGTSHKKLIKINTDNVNIVAAVPWTGTLDCNGCGTFNDDTGTNNGTEPIFALARSNILIDGIHVKNSNNYGIHFRHGSNIRVNNCWLELCALSCLLQYFFSASVSDISFTNNFIDRRSSSFDSAGNGGGLGIFATSAVPANNFTGTRINFSGNKILGKISSGTGTGIEIFANGAQYPAFSFVNVHNNHVLGTSFGISVTNSFNAKVNNNSVSSSDLVGIELGACGYSTCVGNTLNTGTTGILCSAGAANASLFNTVADNAVLGMTGSGIHVAAFNTFTNVVGNVIQAATGGRGITDAAISTDIRSNILDGATIGDIAIDLTGGLSRQITFNRFERWTDFNIAANDSTDVLFGNRGDGALVEVMTGKFTTLQTTTSLATVPSAVLSSSTTGGIGYAAGVGGTVTQATDKSTGVTLNKLSGFITMNGASLANNTSVGFTFTNSTIIASDVVIANIRAGGTTNGYMCTVDAIGTGSCHISIRNISGGSLSEAVVIQFAVIKGVSA